MFKFRKRKLVQNVIRTEDLQVGDVMSISFNTLGTVERLVQLDDSMFWIEIGNVSPADSLNKTLRTTLHRDLKLFVWR